MADEKIPVLRDRLNELLDLHTPFGCPPAAGYPRCGDYDGCEKCWFEYLTGDAHG